MDTKKKIRFYFTCLSTLAGALLMPIFGQWYVQQTGVEPFGFYFLVPIIGLLLWVAFFTNDFNGWD